jgi:hypothetical protein
VANPTMRFRRLPASPAAVLAATTCASLLAGTDAGSLGPSGAGILSAAAAPSRARESANASYGAAAASRAGRRIPAPSDGQSLTLEDGSVSEERLDEILWSLRGGGLFGGRKKENEDKEDDDEDGLYPLLDDASSAASDAAEKALADDGDGDGSIEIDMSSSSPSSSSAAGAEPRRTVEVQATGRHLFSRGDPADPSHRRSPLTSLLASLFPRSPVLPAERSSFVALSTMMFLFIYVFTTVRDTKDTLVVSHCGAESIPYLKLYGVLPCAVGFILLYAKASNVLGREALFHATLLPFFVFYSLFAFVLYPNRDAIHFPMLGMGAGAAASVADAAPGPLSLIRYWSYTLYFIVSELWASAGIPLLFWQVR